MERDEVVEYKEREDSGDEYDEVCTVHCMIIMFFYQKAKWYLALQGCPSPA